MNISNINLNLGSCHGILGCFTVILFRHETRPEGRRLSFKDGFKMA